MAIATEQTDSKLILQTPEPCGFTTLLLLVSAIAYLICAPITGFHALELVLSPEVFRLSCQKIEPTYMDCQRTQPGTFGESTATLDKVRGARLWEEIIEDDDHRYSVYHTVLFSSDETLQIAHSQERPFDLYQTARTDQQSLIRQINSFLQSDQNQLEISYNSRYNEQSLLLIDLAAIVVIGGLLWLVFWFVVSTWRTATLTITFDQTEQQFVIERSRRLFSRRQYPLHLVKTEIVEKDYGDDVKSYSLVMHAKSERSPVIILRDSQPNLQTVQAQIEQFLHPA